MAPIHREANRADEHSAEPLRRSSTGSTPKMLTASVLAPRQARRTPAVPVSQLLRLQRTAGNAAARTLLETPNLSRSGATAPIQREWEPSATEDGIQVWDDVVDGLRWFYNEQTGKLHYQTTPLLVSKAKGAHYQQLVAYAGTAHTYEEWRHFGWGAGGAGNETVAAPAVPKPEPSAASRDYRGVTAGVEQEIKGQFQVQTAARGRLGKVLTKDGSATLVEFETDMKVQGPDNLYTLEFKTTPCALDDEEGLRLRSEAQQFLVGKIREAGRGTGSLVNAESEFVVLRVDRRNFKIVKPSEGKMMFANQLTMGIKTQDLLAAAKSAKGELKPDLSSLRVMGGPEGNKKAQAEQAAHMILLAGSWFNYERSDVLMAEFAARVRDKAHGDGAETAAASFNLLTQLIWFMTNQMMTIARKAEQQQGRAEGRPKTPTELGATVINEEGYPIVDTSLPVYKNAFGTLPKTSPMRWIATLPTPWQLEVREQVGTPPAAFDGPANVYASIWKFIQMGEALAGHPIPLFTISGEDAVAFEFRSMPSYDPKLRGLKYSE